MKTRTCSFLKMEDRARMASPKKDQVQQHLRQLHGASSKEFKKFGWFILSWTQIFLEGTRNVSLVGMGLTAQVCFGIHQWSEYRQYLHRDLLDPNLSFYALNRRISFQPNQQKSTDLLGATRYRGLTFSLKSRHSCHWLTSLSPEWPAGEPDFGQTCDKGKGHMKGQKGRELGMGVCSGCLRPGFLFLSNFLCTSCQKV